MLFIKMMYCILITILIIHGKAIKYFFQFILIYLNTHIITTKKIGIIFYLLNTANTSH